MANDIFFLIILLVLSGFFSSSEIAFVVSNKLKLELRARQKNISAKNAHYFAQKPEYFFSTILIGFLGIPNPISTSAQTGLKSTNFFNFLTKSELII